MRLPKSQRGSNRDLTLLRGKTVILQFGLEDFNHNLQHNPNPKHQNRRLPLTNTPPPPRVAGIRSGRFDKENPFVQNSSVLLVQPDEGVSVLVVDRIGDYLSQSTEKIRVLVIPVGARHKFQQGIRFERPMYDDN
ncbi:hypothetical protein F511_17379 [Dorcoceras hygrometricum]|uniref:Uncharacterized protein n=1 Tax=Dorcoceras hygrometricum TaxID=472368 RepID=A0A2Z7B049_9LAMI|nr:hypothetical protein F511_17379 [Dorcoceras hygrometricum]